MIVSMRRYVCALTLATSSLFAQGTIEVNGWLIRSEVRGGHAIVQGDIIIRTAAPVFVRFGKLPAQIIYVASAPGLVNGALQINAILPKELIGGPDVPVQLIMGSYSSTPGATIPVK